MSVLVAAGDKVGALNEIRVIFLSLPKKEWNVFCQNSKRNGSGNRTRQKGDSGSV